MVHKRSRISEHRGDFVEYEPLINFFKTGIRDRKTRK